VSLGKITNTVHGVFVPQTKEYLGVPMEESLIRQEEGIPKDIPTH